VKAWLAICAVLGGGAAAMAWTQGLASPFEDAATEPLAWNAASWASHPWTLWTAAWVHTSAGGLAGNLLALTALAVVGAAGEREDLLDGLGVPARHRLSRRAAAT